MFKFLKKLFGLEKEVTPTFQETMAKKYIAAREYQLKSTYVEPVSRPRTSTKNPTVSSYRPSQTKQEDSYSSLEDDLLTAAATALIFGALSDSDSSSNSDSSTDSSSSGFDGGFGGGDFSGGGSGGSWDDSSSSSDNDSYSSNDSSDSYSSSGGDY